MELAFIAIAIQTQLSHRYASGLTHQVECITWGYEGHGDDGVTFTLSLRRKPS